MKKNAISFSDHTFGVLEINIGPENNKILLNKFGLYLHSQNSLSLFYLLISIKVFFTDTHVVPKSSQHSRRILVHWETLTYRTGKDCWETGTATGRGWVKGQDALQCFGQSARKCLPIWPPQPGREWGWCDWRRGGRWLGRTRPSSGRRKAGHANRHATTTGKRWRRLEVKEGNWLLTTMEHKWHKKPNNQKKTTRKHLIQD